MMDTRFAEKIYEVLDQISPQLPKDSRRLFAALQDEAGDFPRERKSLRRFADDRFMGICSEGADREEGDIPAVIDRAAGYLCREYLLEEKWARHLASQFALAIWAHENRKPANWLRSRGGKIAGKSEHTQAILDGDGPSGETEIITEDGAAGANARSVFAPSGKPRSRSAAVRRNPSGPGGTSHHGAYPPPAGKASRQDGRMGAGQKKKSILPIALGAGGIAAVLLLAFIFVFDMENPFAKEGTEAGTTQTTSAEEGGASGDDPVEDPTSTEPTEPEPPAIQPEDRVFAHNKTGGSTDPIATFDSAASQGATHIEQDVALADDGKLYVYKGNIQNAAEPASAVQGSPLLSWMFETYGKSFTYVVELKTTSPEAASALVDLIRQNDYEDNVIVQCFEISVLSQIKADLPGVETMCLCDNKNGRNGQQNLENALPGDAVDIICVCEADGLMTQDNLSRVHEAGKEFGAWLMNDEGQIKHAIDMGLDCYFTEYPGRAIGLEKEYRK